MPCGVLRVRAARSATRKGFVFVLAGRALLQALDGRRAEAARTREDVRTRGHLLARGPPPQPSLHTHVYKSAGVLKSWSLPHMTWHIIHARMQCVLCTSWQLVLEIEARGFRVTCWRKGGREEGMQKGGRAVPCNMQTEARGSPLSICKGEGGHLAAALVVVSPPSVSEVQYERRPATSCSARDGRWGKG